MVEVPGPAAALPATLPDMAVADRSPRASAPFPSAPFRAKSGTGPTLPQTRNSETPLLHMRTSMTFRLTPVLCVLMLAGCASALTAGTDLMRNPTAADSRETLAQPCPPAALTGAWGAQPEDPETAFLLDDETFSLVWNGTLAGRARILACAQEDAGQRVDVCDQGVRRSYRFEPAEDGWRVVLPPMGLDVEAVSVRRLAAVPAVFDPRPFPIPPPQPLPPERIEELRAEL